jgi:hypothetical protein
MMRLCVVNPSAARNPAQPGDRGQIPRSPVCDGLSRNDKRARVACLALAVVIISGCRQHPPAEPNSVSSTVERGPLSFTVEVGPKRAWVGDPLTVELRVETPDGYVVQFPGEADLGELHVRDVDTADPRPRAEGGLAWRKTYTAESLTAGVVEVPALAVKYAREPTEAGVEPVFEHELVSDSLQVDVLSALTTQDSVFEPRDITGTLLPPREPLSPRVWAAIIGASLVGLVAIGALVLWLRKRAQRLPPPILPEVWALRALAELQAANLIEGGRAKEFYYRLSEIVRVYIERKFGLAAPEMTTEEFLSTLARGGGVLPYDSDRLRDFLQACDLVKYAALTPLEQEPESALGTARAFIDATAAAAVRAFARDRGQQPGGQAA